MAREWIASGPMAFSLRTAREPVDVSWNPDDVHLAALEPLFRSPPPELSGLVATTTTTTTTTPEREEELAAYRMTLALLRECCAIPLQPDQPIGVKLSLSRWVDRAPERYFELLHEFRPEALVLLAHLCVLIKEGGLRYWWM